MEKKDFNEKIKLASSFDELFDVFRFLVESECKDINAYKSIIGNKYLNDEQVIFFCEKVANEFPELKFDIYLWTGKVFESRCDSEGFEKAFAFYLKSINVDKKRSEPYEQIANLFLISNIFPSLEVTLSALKFGLKESSSKKNIYELLSKVYAKVGNKKLADKYIALAAKKKE